ncbi:MAG: FecR domain-containing protein, partial [Verrucomicrobiota bacterium]|nr:FecR domain-containing protein [Verrucomicrobiota bacterium]
MEPPSHDALLIRYLDGALDARQEREVQDLLKRSPEARASLRSMSELAVSAADLAGTRAVTSDLRGRGAERLQLPLEKTFMESFLKITFKQVLPLVALIAMLVVVVQTLLSPSPVRRLSIEEVSSACQIFTAHGSVQNTLDRGMVIAEGDTIETRSCDSSLDLQLGQSSLLTLAGHTYLQHMERIEDSVRLRLLTGSMWAKVYREETIGPLRIQTSTSLIEIEEAQFDLHTENLFTRLRVNQGQAVVTRLVDQQHQTVQQGEQIEVTMGVDDGFLPNIQPHPVYEWRCRQLEGPDIILGTVHPSAESGFANIKAQPLRYPLEDGEHIMLYATAFHVARNGSNPVLLESGSKLRFHISYQKEKRIRFGFSTQRMRGIYTGKFEEDVWPHQLGAPGEIQQIELPIDRFDPKYPRLSPQPQGLEVNDIYAVTIGE